MDKITVRNIDVRYKKVDTGDFISLTDIARYKNPEDPRFIVYSWLRNKNTIVFLGLWEELHNPDFNRIEFDTVKNEAGLNSFMISPQKWIEKTGAVGLTVSSGRYNSGVYAHQDIAFEFASWVSTEFKLYFIKEFQRLKEEEQQQLGWSAKRELAKVNYRIHTDAIKENLIPAELTPLQISYVYANEADVLNVALFGMTAAQWREQNPDKKGNIRDYATINELICLSKYGEYQRGTDTGRRSAVGETAKAQPYRHIADESLKRNRRQKFVEVSERKSAFTKVRENRL